MLPRYEVKGAGVAGVDGSYTAAQLSHYSGPAPYVQEMVAMRVFSKDPRNVVRQSRPPQHVGLLSLFGQ